jgi:hypothetical protein
MTITTTLNDPNSSLVEGWTALWNGDLSQAATICAEQVTVHFDGRTIAEAGDHVMDASGLADLIGAFRSTRPGRTYRVVKAHLRGWRFSSPAKNTAAFFRISRSSLNTFTSLRSFLNSSRSSVLSPSRSPASISAWLTHLRSVSAETSRSRALSSRYRIALLGGVDQPYGFLLELGRVEPARFAHLLPLSPNLIA